MKTIFKGLQNLASWIFHTAAVLSFIPGALLWLISDFIKDPTMKNSEIISTVKTLIKAFKG